VAAAAYELGIGETTVRQHLSGLYRRTGCVNAAQAAYWLGTTEPRRDHARPACAA
jgi:DNA-binding NarL/FixJ family response regulator